MLATLTQDYFSDPDWIFERKFDGIRCLVFRHPNGVDLRSRNRRKLNETYPELAEALAHQEPGGFLADGEIVAFRGKVTSFQRLQHRIGLEDPEAIRNSRVRVYLYLFDLLYCEGNDVTGLPLRSRKSLLKKAIDFDDPLRLTPHRNKRGEAFLKEACRKHWEGLIAKKANSPYQHSRSRDWLKFKCTNQQEFVIGGFTDPGGERVGFGALLLGYFEDDRLEYAGRVGTGFSDSLLAKLHEKLQGIERSTPAFSEDPSESNVHWVRPELVAEVGFTEWTRDGRLRHPRFLGLRDDKDPSEVVRERPEGNPHG